MGPTHHSIEDLAWLRPLTGLTVIVPADRWETAEAVKWAAARETGAIVTVEEASVRGGLGGAVAELTAANRPVPVERMGFAGFQPTGPVDWLFAENGLTAEGIAAAANRAMGRAQR